MFDILIMSTRLWTQKYNSINLYSCFFFYLYPSHCLEIRLSSRDDSLLQIVDSGRDISSDLRNEIRWEKAEEWGNWFMLLCLSWGIAINWLNKTSSSQCSCFYCQQQVFRNCMLVPACVLSSVTGLYLNSATKEEDSELCENFANNILKKLK